MAKLEREYADLEDIWKMEKPRPRAAQVQRTDQKVKTPSARKDDSSARATSTRSPSCNTASLPELEKRLKNGSVGPGGRWRGPKHRLLRQVGAEEIAEVVRRATGIPWPK